MEFEAFTQPDIGVVIDTIEDFRFDTFLRTEEPGISKLDVNCVRSKNYAKKLDLLPSNYTVFTSSMCH